MKKTLVGMCSVLALVAIAAITAAAQGTGRLDGEIRDLQGNPYADVTVTIKNPDNGASSTTKTDKSGKFTVLGLRTGVYVITLVNEKDKLNFQDKKQITEGSENTYNMNFKELAAKQAAEHPEEAKKKDEEQTKFEGLKAHFMAGVAAMNDAKAVKTQLQAAPTDQSLKDKLAADYQTAATEFKAAEQAAGPKDVANHSLAWANLGAADEGLSQWADAATAFQSAVDLKPSAPYYVAEATDLAKSGKVDDAPAACDKAIALDPSVAVMCWKNLGIVMSNAGKMKEAAALLQKATTADPKDDQAWFLLGNALSATIDTKQQGEKMTYIIPPGTIEAYQKCIDVKPTGPYAAQAKAAIDGLQQLDQGVDTTVGKRAKKKGTGS
ncbi:MAG: carboxypeptidase regulatory-like domain-containing protein [Candidatus Acidiferrales bacterium]